MKRLAILALSLTLTACGTLTPQLTALHVQLTGKLKADFQSVKAVAVASSNPQLGDCADAVLTEQLPPIEALDAVQTAGVFSALALIEAKREALKFRPSVAQKCSAFPWLIARLGLLGQAARQ